MIKRFNKIIAVILSLVLASALFVTGTGAVAAEIERPALNRVSSDLVLGDTREENLESLTMYLAMIEMYGDNSNEQGLYTEDSYAPFAEALEAAYELSENPDDYTDKEVENIVNELLEAWGSLVVDVEANYTLEDLLTYIDEYVASYSETLAAEDDYTEDSFAAFEEAYKELLKIKKSAEDYTLVEIYDALLAVDDAYYALEAEITHDLLKETADGVWAEITENIGWESLDSSKAFQDACAAAYAAAEDEDSTLEEREEAYNALVEAYNAWWAEAEALIADESFKYGDVNGDGSLGMTDVVEIQKYASTKSNSAI